MPNATSRFGLDQFNESERWKEAGTNAGAGDPDGHNDAVRHVDTHTLLVVEQTVDYTASNYDMVLANATGGDFNVTMPAPSTDVQVDTKLVSASGNVTIEPENASAGQTIDGNQNMTLQTQYASRTVVANSTDYFVR